MSDAAKRAAYKAYIFSEAWVAKRQAFLAANPAARCHWCKRPWSQGFHVHHATYERFTCERLSDLRAMCAPCHKLLHKLHKLEGPDTNLEELTDRYANGKQPKSAPIEVKQLWLRASMAARKQEIRLAKLRKVKAAKRARGE